MRRSAARPRRAALAALLALGVLATGAGCQATGAGVEPREGAHDSRPTHSAEQDPAPALSPADERNERATELVAAMTPRERAGSIVMGAHATGDPAEAARYVEELGLGGFLVMPPNVRGGPEELSTFTAAVRGAFTGTGEVGEVPPLIAVDQEGGVVSRLPWDPAPGALALHTAPVADAESAFAARGQMLAEAGISVNFGIVADVAPSPDSFIFSRQLGLDVPAAAERVAAAVTGQHATTDAAGDPRVAATIKHFPGHGAAPGDSHVGIPTTDLPVDEWEATHAVPFAAGIDAGADLLMFGHLAFTAVDPAPASLSPAWHRIAREELGFDGVVVSDDLGMLLDSGVPEYQDLPSVAARALAAGTDLLLFVRGSDPATLDAVIGALESAERLDSAAVRVMELRLRLAGDA